MAVINHLNQDVVGLCTDPKCVVIGSDLHYSLSKSFSLNDPETNTNI